MAKAVTIVDSGGFPVTNTSSLLAGTPMTPVDAGGMAVTLVDSGGYPVCLIEEDGTLWSGGGGIPEDPFEGVTNYADYATGLAAVSDGQYFGVLSADSLTRMVYLRTSSHGEWQGSGPVDWATVTTIREAIADAEPSDAIIDLISLDSFYHDGVIENRQLGTTPDLNLFGASRPGEMPFVDPIALARGWTHQNGSGWTSTLGQTDEDGGTTALRVVQTGTGSNPLHRRDISVPPGRWTLCVRMKENGGAKTLYIGNNFATGMQACSVTTSYQTFFTTFTLASTTSRTMISVGFASASVAFDVTITGIWLVPGTVSSTPAHSSPGHGWSNRQNSRSGYFVGDNDASPLQYYDVNKHPSASYSAVSWSAAVKHTGAFSNAYAPVISALEEVSGGSVAFAGGKVNFTTGAAKGITPANRNSGVAYSVGFDVNEWLVLTASSGASGNKLWINGVLVHSNATALTSFTTRVFEALAHNRSTSAGAFRGIGAVFTLGTRQWSDAECDAATARTLAALEEMGGAINPSPAFCCFEGDSITTGNTYVANAGVAFEPYLQGRDFAVGGSNFTTMNARKSTVTAFIATLVAAGYTPIVTIQIGTNDQPQTTGAADTLWTNLKAYAADCRTAGAKVIFVTPQGCNPASANTSLATYETTGRPQLVSNILAANIGTDCDAICDLTGVSQWQTWNVSNFTDDAHPNAATQALASPALIAAIDSLGISGLTLA